MKKLLRRFFVLVILVVAIFGVLQWRSYTKLKDAFKEGMVYFEEEDYQKSCQIFERAMEQNCIFGKDIKNEMRCYQADGYYGLGEYDKAIEIYSDLLKHNKNNKNLYLMQGACYQGAGDLEKALDIYSEGWDKTKDLIFLKKLSRICIQEGDMDAAISYINVGKKEGGDDIKEFMFDEIVVYEKQLDFDKAYEAAKAFCEKYPEDEKGKKERIFLSTRI